MKRRRLGVGLLALVNTGAASTALPYNPARLFASANSSTAYAFQPTTDGQFSFSSLDLAAGVSRSNQSFTTLSTSLPFLKTNSPMGFTPIFDGHGNFDVVAGDCTKGPKGLEAWRWTVQTENQKSDPSGATWTQMQVSNQGLEDVACGANFLASGISFSEIVNDDGSNTNIYVFGGMCPSNSDASASSWIDSASYSNYMLDLSPAGSNDGNIQFNLGQAESQGPPIPEAGFTITPLPPNSGGNSTGGPGTQQQNFILIGGHTQQAFINMSQVAVYSLPQNTWTFVPVASSQTAKADLAVRQNIQEVQPRSGHTAVLSEDGQSVIVFGGWVGDVSTPATPQLAILDLGTSSGSNGAWTWSTPSGDTSSSGLTSGSGIYGHGAAMLPGGVMMVVGGNSISSASSSRRKRQKRASNSQIYLFNVTSQSWIDTYVPPDSLLDQENPSSSKNQQVGLGAGLGVGGAVLLSLIILYFWYRRRLRKSREERAQAMFSELQNSSYPQGVNQPFLQYNPSEKGLLSRNPSSWSDMEIPSVYDISPQAETENIPEKRNLIGSTGLALDLPSPTRGLRKVSAGKSYLYHSTPRFDERSAAGSRGGIHPIAEHENEDGTESKTAAIGHAMLNNAERKLLELQNVLATNDPSAEPNPLGSHPVVAESRVSGGTVRKGPCLMKGARRTPVAELEDTSNWYEGQGYDDSSYAMSDHTDGRTSPSKTDDRTSSMMSDGSQYSTYSGTSIQRTMSMRTASIMQAAAQRETSVRSFESSRSGSRRGPLGPRSDSSSPNRPPRSMSTSPTHYSSHTQSSANDTSIGMVGSDLESYATAKSNFVHLQNQGQALLAANNYVNSFDDRSNSTSPASIHGRLAPSYLIPQPLQSSVSRRRPNGLLGSLRRALNVVSGERGGMGYDESVQYTEHAQDNLIQSSVRDRVGPVQRRATSDGGGPNRLLSQKRGRKDWEPYLDEPDTGDWGDSIAVAPSILLTEEEWDIESAAKQRDVQVMFSVPKSRLRVVNADMDRASLRSISEGGLSRTESMRHAAEEETLLYRPQSYRREDVASLRGSASMQILRPPSDVSSLRGSSSAQALRSVGSCSTIIPAKRAPLSPMPTIHMEESMVDSRVEDYYDDKLAVFGSSLGRPKGP
ncbi:Hypothetical protein R9X50_00385100 [Acrodontium crateriforme]|uniref:Galactose oxidase/kelch, beta-propeller n=1 Tax=Acrodontium crateriforme TaxID=150365 RepID=A0AAQ3M3A2_9PEZI|nr:Hypothetical protein R9X50_00385100 [Acrodontium crateriforme]